MNLGIYEFVKAPSFKPFTWRDRYECRFDGVSIVLGLSHENEVHLIINKKYYRGLEKSWPMESNWQGEAEVLISEWLEAQVRGPGHPDYKEKRKDDVA